VNKLRNPRETDRGCGPMGAFGRGQLKTKNLQARTHDLQAIFDAMYYLPDATRAGDRPALPSGSTKPRYPGIAWEPL